MTRHAKPPARPRDGCEWWTSDRADAYVQGVLADRHRRTYSATHAAVQAVMHSSWCGSIVKGGCNCVPITLTFGPEV